mmetsp:Transcript_22092/g.50490  ORF Transcript_22092/g.50490 Transcript_22092/m.50490 type:complete len:265 (+) Transcript_22092:167-961(+)
MSPSVPSWASDLVPDWPDWAMRLMLSAGGVLLLATAASFVHDRMSLPKSAASAAAGDDLALRSKFLRFKRQYLLVYLVIMLADWMQGTHMYTLYLSYEVNISALFLTGFLSGAVFAPFLGSLVDKYGRKNFCLVYCVLEIIINALEHSHDFKTLLLGRVLGGISTNLLFSAFESWMTTQHRKSGFPEDWLSTIYAEVSHGRVYRRPVASSRPPFVFASTFRTRAPSSTDPRPSWPASSRSCWKTVWDTSDPSRAPSRSRCWRCC